MKNKIQLFFAGDFCSKPSASKISVSDELKQLIQCCDLKAVNFEVPLKPKIELPPQKRERFYQNDDVPDFLFKLGFNLFTVANNHTFDWSVEGYKKTKAALDGKAFGAGTYDEAYKPKVMEVNGKKIGFLGLSFAAYTGVFNDVANHEGLGCAYINDLKVNHVIIEAKKQLDYLFVLPHDGIEYIDIPMPETIARYHDFIDYGADGVIATHPHCPQGWEEYKGKPIFYSLGNFLFNSKEVYDYRATNRAHWYEGLCILITIDGGKLTWQVVNTKNIDNQRIVIDYDEERNKHNERICQYLTNKTEYNAQLKKACHDLGLKEMTIIDRTMHPQSLKACTRILLSHWEKKILGRNENNDNSLRWLLQNDTRRSLLQQFITFQD